MGAGFSGFFAAGMGPTKGETPSQPTSLGDIPENCVALVLTHLDPPQICKLARLNRVFRQASLSDFVWESKLPENYGGLVKKLFNENPENLSKREIVARLCRPNHLDGGTKEVWMEKNGGICVSISWKGLKITGIDDRRYWKHIPTTESRFQTIAYLQQIWWVEVDGSLEFEFPTGTYSLYFRLQLGTPTKLRRRSESSSLDPVHGWDIKPVRFQLSATGGQRATSQRYLLDEPGKWVHHHVGDFVVRNPAPATKINFSMTQIDCTHTKGGLCLDSVIILPK